MAHKIRENTLFIRYLFQNDSQKQNCQHSSIYIYIYIYIGVLSVSYVRG